MPRTKAPFSCNRCHTSDPTAFYAYKRGRCKECIRRYQRGASVERRATGGERLRQLERGYRKAWNEANPEKVEEQAFLGRIRRAGLGDAPLSEVRKMLSGSCTICNLKAEEHPISLALDHNHVTGEFRGVLCTVCNTGLGYFRDKPELLRRAAEYLENKAGSVSVNDP